MSVNIPHFTLPKMGNRLDHTCLPINQQLPPKRSWLYTTINPSPYSPSKAHPWMLCLGTSSQAGPAATYLITLLHFAVHTLYTTLGILASEVRSHVGE